MIVVYKRVVNKRGLIEWFIRVVYQRVVYKRVV